MLAYKNLMLICSRRHSRINANGAAGFAVQFSKKNCLSKSNLSILFIKQFLAEIKAF